VNRSQRNNWNGKLGIGQLLMCGCGYVQNTAQLSLSCDRRIKMEQTKFTSLLQGELA